MLTLILGLLLTQDPDPPPVREILFVGNSITYYNEMPAMLQKLFDAGGDNYIVYQSTFTDRSLIDHYNWIREKKPDMVRLADSSKKEWPRTADNLTVRNWDIVILQDATLNILIPGTRQQIFEPAVLQLNNLIGETGARTLLFQNYPLGIYPGHYCIDKRKLIPGTKDEMMCSAVFENSYEEMQVIERNIRTLASKIDAQVVPVGEAFEKNRYKYPGIPLYADKWDQHPSREASYLIACMFYNHITGKNISGLIEYGDINQKEAANIQSVADSFYNRRSFSRLMKRIFPLHRKTAA